MHVMMVYGEFIQETCVQLCQKLAAHTLFPLEMIFIWLTQAPKP